MDPTVYAHEITIEDDQSEVRAEEFHDYSAHYPDPGYEETIQSVEYSPQHTLKATYTSPTTTKWSSEYSPEERSELSFYIGCGISEGEFVKHALRGGSKSRYTALINLAYSSRKKNLRNK